MIARRALLALGAVASASVGHAAPRVDRSAAAATIAAVERAVTADDGTLSDPDRAAIRAWRLSAVETVHALAGDDAEAPELACPLTRRAPTLATELASVFGDAVRCLDAHGKPGCRPLLAARLATLRRTLTAEDFAVPAGALEREREATLPPWTAQLEGAYVAEHARDECIAAIPLWPPGQAGPIGAIEACKQKSTNAVDAEITAASETARLEHLVRSARVDACIAALPPRQNPHQCRRLYATPATLTELAAALRGEAARLHALFAIATARNPEILAALQKVVQRGDCLRVRVPPGEAPPTCDLATLTDAPTPRQKADATVLYAALRRRSWWVTLLGTQTTIPRDPLHLTCTEEQRADEYAASLVRLVDEAARCITKAAQEKSVEKVVGESASCRRRLVGARAALRK